MTRTLGSLRALAAATAIACTLAGGVVAQEPGPVGDWEGTLSAGGQEFPLVFHITAADDGTLSTTLDSPSQGAFGMQGDSTAFADGTLTIAFTSIAGSFEAALSEEGDTLAGTWSQAGMSFPLELTRKKD